MKRRSAVVTLATLSALALFALYARYFKDNAAPQVVFTSIQGEKLSTADLRGRVVLVNFWATDCPVCVKEMPRLVQTYRSYAPRGLELIAVAMKYDPPNYVLDYTDRNKLPFKVALDPMGDLAKAFDGVQLTPTTVLIDKKGRVVQRILGEPDFPKLEKLIEEKLADAA
jgi:peroxiredoxin